MIAHNLSYSELCAFQVRWYRRVGRHQDRVRRDSHGVEYVVGDWSWNRLYPQRPEFIDSRMADLKY